MIAIISGLDRSPVDVHDEAKPAAIFPDPAPRLSPLGQSAHTDEVSDDDDRPRDAGSAADPARSDSARGDSAGSDTDWSNAVAPDDISSLAADIAAYRREQRATRRRELMRRFLDRPTVVPILLILAGFAIAAIAATLLTVMRPDAAGRAPTQLPLAGSGAAVGKVHGLVPSVALRYTSANTLVPVRSLRPTVLAVIPARCDCAPLLNSLSGGAASERLPLDVVAPTAADADVLSGPLNQGSADIYYDTTGTLASGVQAQGVTLIVVNRDGTIFAISRSVTSEAGSHLDAQLQAMRASWTPTGD
jgi:hypothetical protein